MYVVGINYFYGTGMKKTSLMRLLLFRVLNDEKELFPPRSQVRAF